MSTNEAKVAACESIIAYEFQNKLLCLEALQASGHLLRWDRNLIHVERNDRLAVFGDAVAKAFLCKQWLDADRSKGQWTQVEQALLANSSLSAVGFEHNLDTCIILNMGTPSVSQKTMATTVEAVLGAVYRDGGENALVAVLAVLGLTHVFLEVTGRGGDSCNLRGCLQFLSRWGSCSMRTLSDPEIKRIFCKDGLESPCDWIFFATDFQGNFVGDIDPLHAMVP